jgi:hypothetical protein
VTEVRRHQRRTASGKTATVRQHTRDTGDGARDAWAARMEAARQPSAAPVVGGPELTAQPEPVAQDWWDGEEAPEGDFWDEPAIGWSEEAEQRLRGKWEREKDERLAGWSAEVAAMRAEDPRHAPVTPQFLDLQQEMRDWRSLPEPDPAPAEPMPAAKAELLGCDTPEGRAKYDRLRAYREAGYTGPLDQDNRIPDPDDPASHQMLSALARMSEPDGR